MKIGPFGIRVKGWLLPALLILLMTGCASIPSDIAALPDADELIELEETPFFPQEEYQCGPAALTTVLVASGTSVSLEEIVGKVYLPGRHGSLQVEMLAAARTSGRLPYVIDSRLDAIHDELAAGRPVLVLQNLGVSVIPRWHYAVVVGIDTDRDRVILRSGEERRHEVRILTFLRTWRRSDYWAMVVLQPGTLPANVDRQRYASAVAALESAGQRQAAQIAWRAALARWPHDSIAMFGLAGVLAATGKHADAVMMYRGILKQDSMAIVVRNNLALSLAKLGHFDDAGREIARAIRDNQDTGLEAELLDTQGTLHNMQLMIRTAEGE